MQRSTLLVYTHHDVHLAMQVRQITTWPELAALQSEWNGLTAEVPFQSWDWIATWWNHYGSGTPANEAPPATNRSRQLYVLAVYDDAADGQTLIGISPWYLDQSAIKGSVLRWLGDGEVCTDHLSLVCRAVDRQRVAAAVAEALTVSHDDWDQLQLSAVDEDDAAIALLLAELEQRECIVSRQPADACWSLDLPATWDDYLAAISKSHRKQLRQLERRVLETERVRWQRVESAGELDAGWAVLVDLHQRRRRSLGEPGCFASRPFYSFHREVVERLLGRDQLRMSWLALDGRPAAAEYHLAGSRTTFAYQGGVDPDRLDDEPGRLSTILCLRKAIEDGHTQLDFLRGDEPYKAHWRATPRPTLDCRVVPNRRLARLRGRVLNMADILGDWARQGAQIASFTTNS